MRAPPPIQGGRRGLASPAHPHAHASLPCEPPPASLSLGRHQATSASSDRDGRHRHCQPPPWLSPSLVSPARPQPPSPSSDSPRAGRTSPSSDSPCTRQIAVASTPVLNPARPRRQTPVPPLILPATAAPSLALRRAEPRRGRRGSLLRSSPTRPARSHRQSLLRSSPDGREASLPTCTAEGRCILQPRWIRRLVREGAG